MYVLNDFYFLKVGTLVRHAIWIVLGLLAFFIIGFSFLPGAGEVYRRAFSLNWSDVSMSLVCIPIYGLSAFGAGWGVFVTLSSFNKFKTNIIRSSCLIAFGQFGIMLGLSFLTKFSEAYFNGKYLLFYFEKLSLSTIWIYFFKHFAEKTDSNYYSMVDHSWTLYLSSGSVIAHMPWANLWSILFFFMLFWSNLVLVVIKGHIVVGKIVFEIILRFWKQFCRCEVWTYL